MADPFFRFIKGRLFLAGVLILLAAGFGYWLSQNLVRESMTVEKPYSGKARLNWLYAAQRLLTRLGVSAHSVRHPAALPEALDAEDTVILTMPGYALTEDQAQGLLHWVEEGGHLLFTVYQPYEPGQGADRLLNYLGVGVREAETAPAEPVEVEWDEEQPPLQIKFLGNYYLQPEGGAERSAGDGQGSRLLQYRAGEGLMTVLSDLSLFGNERLAEYDHADLLWALLHQEGRRGEVWLQYIPWMPSLARLLWNRAWMPITALLVTLLAALWTVSRRLGPVLMVRTDERRSLLEHIRASGHFLWHYDAREALLEAVRQRVVHKLEGRFLRWRQLSREDRIGHLAALTGLTTEQVAAALQPSDSLGEREFLERVQWLRQIERALYLPRR